MRKLNTEELNRMSAGDFHAAKKTPVFIVLDNIRSLNNIGSVFRTADAFRIAGIYLCGISGTPPHREISKTALGATESVEWIYFEHTIEAINLLKEQGVAILAIEQTTDSMDLKNFIPKPSAVIALVFGNEVSGVSEEVLPLVDGCLEIPQFGTKHSFNVAVSAGIVLYDIFHKLSK
jgi:23S rRNA (guanosine2251-2'-O)-methyltransferase